MGKQHTKIKKCLTSKEKVVRQKQQRQATFFHFSVQFTFFKCIPPYGCSNDRCHACPAVVQFSTTPGLQKKIDSMSKALHSIRCSMQFDHPCWRWDDHEERPKKGAICVAAEGQARQSMCRDGWNNRRKEKSKWLRITNSNTRCIGWNCIGQNAHQPAPEIKSE